MHGQIYPKVWHRLHAMADPAGVHACACLVGIFNTIYADRIAILKDSDCTDRHVAFKDSEKMGVKLVGKHRALIKQLIMIDNDKLIKRSSIIENAFIALEKSHATPTRKFQLSASQTAVEVKGWARAEADKIRIIFAKL